MQKDQQKLAQLIQGKKVAFIGAGVSHKTLIKEFVELGAHVTLCDQKKSVEDFGDYAATIRELGIDLSLGENYLDGFKGQDIIMRTPGFVGYFEKPLQDAMAAGTMVTVRAMQSKVAVKNFLMNQTPVVAEFPPPPRLKRPSGAASQRGLLVVPLAGSVSLSGPAALDGRHYTQNPSPWQIPVLGKNSGKAAMALAGLSKILFLIVTLFIGFVISLALFVTILLPFWRNFVTVHKI